MMHALRHAHLQPPGIMHTVGHGMSSVEQHKRGNNGPRKCAVDDAHGIPACRSPFRAFLRINPQD
eukprot:1147818-Pelagomonas_calceolata.AAC.6